MTAITSALHLDADMMRFLRVIYNEMLKQNPRFKKAARKSTKEEPIWDKPWYPIRTDKKKSSGFIPLSWSDAWEATRRLNDKYQESGVTKFEDIHLRELCDSGALIKAHGTEIWPSSLYDLYRYTLC